MAEKTLVIKILGDASQWNQTAASIGKTLNVLGGAALIFGKNAVAASMESDQAIAQLGNTIEATGRKTAGLQTGITQLATQIQNYSGISDEAVISAQTMLLQFENIGDDA